jgi:ATP-dependent helicase/nuclease subunit A
VAGRVAELVAGGAHLRDIALLFSSWSDVGLYQAALTRRRIATYALRQEGLYARREVLDLILALEAVRDPADDRALFGWLRSPFVGVKDETLLAIARAAPPPYWPGLEMVECAERELLERGRALLAEHVGLRDRVPTAELIESLLERSGYLAWLSLLGDDGLQAIANLRKVTRLARRAPEQSVGDFLRTLHEAQARGDREGDARLYGERDEVVTLTSVHSSKGLEWPVVFWCDVARGAAGGGRAGLLIGRDRIALKDPDADAGDQPLHYRSILAEEDNEALAERKRLWYVASTRAKDRLIVSGFCPGARSEAKTAGGALLAALGPLDARDFPCTVRPAPALDGEPAAAATECPDVPLPEPLTPIGVPQGRLRHSATELMALARCERRHWFRYIAGLREPSSGAGGTGAIVRGQIVHQVLEQLGAEDPDLLLETAIGRWDPDAPTPDGPGGTAYRAPLRQDIAAVAGDSAYRALADTAGASREVQFMFLGDDDACLEGAVDLAAPTGSGLTLLDVKTHGGNADQSQVMERYLIQREVYVAAAEALTDRPVERFAFQFPAAGQLAVDVTQPMRDAGRAHLAELLGRLGRAEPTLARDPADCDRCGYREAGWCPGVSTGREQRLEIPSGSP